jgi:hypothetical protein
MSTMGPEYEELKTVHQQKLIADVSAFVPNIETFLTPGHRAFMVRKHRYWIVCLY